MVGFYGYPHNLLLKTNEVFRNDFTAQTSQLGFISIESNQLDPQGPLILRGIEWIFTWVESAVAYASTIVYESDFSSTDITNIEQMLWSFDNKLQLFFIICVLNDILNITDLITFPFMDNWYNYINTISSNIVFNIEHPEHKFFYNSALIDFILPYALNIRGLLGVEGATEGIILIPFMLLELMWKFILVGTFVLFLMNWYNVSVNSNTVDSDF